MPVGGYHALDLDELSWTTGNMVRKQNEVRAGGNSNYDGFDDDGRTVPNVKACQGSHAPNPKSEIACALLIVYIAVTHSSDIRMPR